MPYDPNRPVSAGTRGFGSRTPSANGSPMASANLCGESPGRGGGDGEPASRRRLLEEQLPIETNPYVSRGSRAGADAARLQPRVQDESDPAQDVSVDEEDEGRTLDPHNPAFRFIMEDTRFIMEDTVWTEQNFRPMFLTLPK